MDRDSAVALAKQRLQRTNDPTADAKIVAEMQSTQQELEQNLEQDMPWFLLSEDLSTETVAGEERVAVPDGMLREFEDGALFLLDPTSGKYKPLRKDDFDVIDNRFKEYDPTEPRQYALVGNYFVLRPVPDDVYTVRMRCYMADTQLTTNVENKWLKYAFEWFMAETLAKVAALHLRDLELSQVYANSVPGLKNKVYRAGLARQLANMDMSIGDDA